MNSDVRIVPLPGVIVLQCDWNESFRNGESAWVYYKPLGQKSDHGKITGADSSDGKFTVTAKTERTVTVKHRPSLQTAVFVAPVSTFRGIHKKSVISIDVANGGLGVSVCGENKLHVWETHSGTVRRTLEGHLFDVYTCRLFPSGVVVLSGGGDMQLRIWDAATGICPVILQGHTGAVTDSAFIERGKNIISVSKDKTVRMWNCAEAKCIATLCTLDSEINCCALRNIPNEAELNLPAEVSGELEYGTAGKVLAVGCDDGTLVILHVASREILFTHTLSSPVLAVAWLPSGVVVIGLEDGRLMGLDIKSLQSPYVISHDSASPIQSLHVVLVSIIAGRRDGLCQIYNVQGHCTSQLTGSDCDPIYGIAHDDEFIYTACRDSSIRKYAIQDITF